MLSYILGSAEPSIYESNTFYDLKMNDKGGAGFVSLYLTNIFTFLYFL